MSRRRACDESPVTLSAPCARRRAAVASKAYRSHFHAIDAIPRYIYLYICIPYTKTLDAYSRVVHLVDDNDQKAHAQRLAEHGVLSRLAAPLEARLELAFPQLRQQPQPFLVSGERSVQRNNVPALVG